MHNSALARFAGLDWRRKRMRVDWGPTRTRRKNEDPTVTALQAIKPKSASAATRAACMSADERGERLFPKPMAELDAIKRRTLLGLMIGRDRKDWLLKEIVRAAKLREPSTSFYY